MQIPPAAEWGADWGGKAWQSTESRQPAAGSRLSAVGSLARTKAPGKRYNSSGRSDFMPDFNYQYAPSTWSTDPRLPSLLHPPLPIPLCVQSNNGHKSFHMPSVWSVLLLLVLLAQSSRTVAREFRLAMQYFILEQTSTRSFFFGAARVVTILSVYLLLLSFSVCFVNCQRQ